MQGAFKPGWEFFEDLESQIDGDDDKAVAEREKVKQLKQDYKEVFSGPAAERVLADLKKRYVDPDVMQGYYPDGTNTAIAMAVRATEVRVIKQLLTIIKPREK